MNAVCFWVGFSQLCISLLQTHEAKFYSLAPVYPLWLMTQAHHVHELCQAAPLLQSGPRTVGDMRAPLRQLL